MYGSPVSKDLNLPVQPPPMASSGLLRYRSAPSSVLGELCEDFLPPGPRAASPDTGADNVFARFLADHHHIRDDKPSPPPAPHFPGEAGMEASQQQQQQLMFQSQHHQQQQEMVDAKSGLYRTVSSGMEPATAAVGASNLTRQSSSPAGFLDNLNMDNGWSLLNFAFFWCYCCCHSLLASCEAIIAALGEFLYLKAFLFLELSVSHLHLCRLLNSGYGAMLRAGMSMGFRDGSSAATADSLAGGGSRLKGQLSFSSRQGSLMSQISEMDSEEVGGSSPEAAGGGRGYIPGFPMGPGWEDSSSLMPDNFSGMKRPRDSLEPGQVCAPLY
jgi:hypothetical protein